MLFQLGLEATLKDKIAVTELWVEGIASLIRNECRQSQCDCDRTVSYKLMAQTMLSPLQTAVEREDETKRLERQTLLVLDVALKSECPALVAKLLGLVISTSAVFVHISDQTHVLVVYRNHA
jgi:hypothetical protein